MLCTTDNDDDDTCAKGYTLLKGIRTIAIYYYYAKYIVNIHANYK